MALTEAEIQQVNAMLDKLSQSQKDRVLSSQESFNNWLYNTAYSIYCKVRDWLSDLWDWLF
jgi:hypothetical protein